MKPGSSQFSSRWMSPYLDKKLLSGLWVSIQQLVNENKPKWRLQLQNRQTYWFWRFWSLELLHTVGSVLCCGLVVWSDPGDWLRERSSSVQRVNSELLIYKLCVVGRQANRWVLSERTGPLHDRTLQRQQNNSSSVLNTLAWSHHFI